MGEVPKAVTRRMLDTRVEHLKSKVLLIELWQTVVRRSHLEVGYVDLADTME